MILTTQKNYVLPLDGKIKIAGMRVETGGRFEQKIVSGKLSLRDSWNIQIIYTPADSPATAELTLLEHPVLWEDEFEWNQDYPGHFRFFYKKAPSAVTSHIREEKRNFRLCLTVEAVIGVEIGSGGEAESEKSAITPGSHGTYGVQEQLSALEAKIDSLSQTVSKLEGEVQKLKEISSLLPALQGRLAGMVFDEFRMIPVAKCILEFTPTGSEEPCVKTVTDNNGYFTCERLQPATYEIKIRHPRYLPLVIKDFIINERENRYQDFILRRG